MLQLLAALRFQYKNIKAGYTNYEEGLKLITGETQVRQETQDYIKSQVWDKLIKTYSLSNSFEDLGIDVSDMGISKDYQR
jgi:hypothetical protein